MSEPSGSSRGARGAQPAPRRSLRATALAGLVLAALLAALAHAGAPTPATAHVVRLGSGADEVWLFWPRAPVRAIVVFGHGWSTPYPTAFAPWIAHLRSRGDLVVYPRYERTTLDSETSAFAALEHGIVAAFGRLRSVHAPVVAVGKSFAGGEIFYYAVDAGAWGVPAPSAVLSVFPAIPFNGVPSRPLPPQTYVEVLVGDRDTTVGSTGAQILWRWLASHASSEKRYVLVRSSPGFVANHDSPRLTSAPARAAYWRPLDLLVARALRLGVRGG